MKKIVLLAIAVCFMLGTWAQSSPNYTLKGQNSKAFDFYAGITTRFVAEENGQLLLTTRTTKSLLIVRILDDIMVRWVDKELNVQQEYVLPDSRQYELLATTMADGEVSLLVKFWEKKMLVVKRIILDKSTLQPKNEEVLYTHEVANADLAICMAATSESGDFTALMALTVEFKGDVECRMFLLDDHMGKLWDREPVLKDCYGLWVSNEGEVYMASSAGSKVLFAKLTDDDNYQYFVETPSPVGTLRLLNVVDDCIVVGGTYTYEEKGMNGFVKGYFGVSYNMATGKLAGLESKVLSADDVRVIQNWKNNARSRECSGILMVASHAATTYGGAMALANISHTIIQNQNGATTEYYTQGGLLTFGVNAKGELVWSYPIRHYEKAPSVQLFSQPMVADGDRVYLFLSEDSKASATYTIDKYQKQKNPIGKANDLVMYSFDESGMMGKRVVAPKQKGVLAGGFQHWFDGHYYLMHSNNKKGGLMILNTQN